MKATAKDPSKNSETLMHANKALEQAAKMKAHASQVRVDPAMTKAIQKNLNECREQAEICRLRRKSQE